MGTEMKLFRYRKPSLNTILGITNAKKEVKRNLGIYKVIKILNFPTNLKRRALRKVGYYSEPVRILRNGLRKPGGCLIIIGIGISATSLFVYLMR